MDDNVIRALSVLYLGNLRALGVVSRASGARQTGPRDWLCHFSAGQTCTNHLVSLRLNFLMSKWG